jgi:hypothetical protein
MCTYFGECKDVKLRYVHNMKTMRHEVMNRTYSITTVKCEVKNCTQSITTVTRDVKNCMHSKTTVICGVRNSTHNKTIQVRTLCFNYLENCKTYPESELEVKCVLYFCFQLAHHGGIWAH